MALPVMGTKRTSSIFSSMNLAILLPEQNELLNAARLPYRNDQPPSIL